jgi:hypothetical protein
MMGSLLSWAQFMLLPLPADKKKSILSFTAMCCITINPGEARHENQSFKRVSLRTAREAALFELALASLIREEDIAALAGCLNQKLQEKPSWLAGPDRPMQTEATPLLLLTQDFWQFILTSVDQHQAFAVTGPLLSPHHLAYWLDLFNTTIEEHFCGTISCVAKDKVVKHIDSFLYRLLLLSR